MSVHGMLPPAPGSGSGAAVGVEMEGWGYRWCGPHKVPPDVHVAERTSRLVRAGQVVHMAATAASM